MENKKIPKIYGFIFIISILLLSVNIVSSIGIWKNRSFYFDEYIYSSNLISALTNYCADLNRFISEELSEDEKENFLARSFGVYYYVTDDDTKEVFNNIPEHMDYTEFSSQPGIKTLLYETNDPYIINDSGFLTRTTSDGNNNKRFSGYVFIDIGAGPLLSSYFLYLIDSGFGQQRVLYIESVIFAISFIFGGVMLIISLRNLKSTAALADYMPLDAVLFMPVLATMIWLFLIETYLSSIKGFSFLSRRIILYAILVMLTFIILFFGISLILKARLYMADKAKFKHDWENRLTKNIPAWIVELTLMVIWYFVIISSFSLDRSIFNYFLMLKNNVFIIIFHNAVMAIVFLFIRKIVRTKTLYAEEVLRAAQEIANGNFERTIPVIGNDAYAQIASTTNEIRERYIHALEEQKKSERLKYELVTNISHDLRTPLTSIINYIGLVKRGEMPNDMKRYISLADTNANKLNLLIEDLFELSKIESGNMELTISDVDIVLLLKQISHEYEEKIKRNELELILGFSNDHYILQCDSIKIWRVFDNIINNAAKYSLAGTRIYVSATEENNRLIVSVKNIASYKMDFGPEELFLRFKRGDDSRSTEGSGLGLAIAKGLVDLHKGNIHIETEGDMFKVIVNL